MVRRKSDNNILLDHVVDSVYLVHVLHVLDVYAQHCDCQHYSVQYLQYCQHGLQ